MSKMEEPQQCPGCSKVAPLYKVITGRYSRQACWDCNRKKDVMDKIPATYLGQGWDAEHYAAWEEHVRLHS